MFRHLFIFLLGAASGSLIEYLYHAAKKLPPIRGLLFPVPLKPIYGFGVILTVYAVSALQPWPLPFEWLALSVLLGAYELAGGLMSERLLKRRLWRYDPSFLNAYGYSDAFHAGAWGALGLAFSYGLNPLLAAF